MLSNEPKKDVEMKTGEIEGSKGTVAEGNREEMLDMLSRPMSTFLTRPFFSSSNWPLSIWEEFKPLEEEMDRRFKTFEKEMEDARKVMLEDF